MDYELSNGILSARVSSRGAELKSLVFQGAEYLWPGGEVWGWSAPVCCPWCGALEAFTHGGRRYAPGRHGFVREREHRLVERAPDALTLGLEVSTGDERWPWPFDLTAQYTLRGQCLTLAYRIGNTGGEPMPLQFGFHPGFLAPAGSAIRAEQPDIPGFGDRMPLVPGVFDNDSLHLERPSSAWFRLDRGDGRSVQVDTAGWPHVLLWGTPGDTPFACIEPWTGYPAAGGPFDRPGVLPLESGAALERQLSITVL